jgi:hypothetical protein
LGSSLDILSTNDWVPLTTVAGGSGSTKITVGDSADIQPMSFVNGPATLSATGISRSAPASILLKGVRRVIVLVDTAASMTVNKGVIGGNFRC